MYFQKLKGKLALGVFELNNDQEFQQRFATDPELDALDAQEIDYRLEENMVKAAMGYQFEWKGFKFNHIKPWHLSILWAERSPVLLDISKASIKDYDFFFWLLDSDKKDIGLKAKSAYYTVMHYFDIIADIPKIINDLLKIAFYPLTFIPRVGNTVVKKNEAVYDFDWLISVIYDCGIPLDEAMDKPLCVIDSIFVQKLKANRDLHVGRQSPEEIMRQKDYRTCEMVADRLIEKGILEAENRNDFIDLVTTKPDK